jgi:hypothetical protein
MESIHIEYSTYQDLNSGINPASKLETTSQIKEGKSYNTTVDGVTYPIGVNEENDLILNKTEKKRIHYPMIFILSKGDMFYY